MMTLLFKIKNKSHWKEFFIKLTLTQLIFYVNIFVSCKRGEVTYSFSVYIKYLDTSLTSRFLFGE